MSTKKEYSAAFKSWVECQKNTMKQIEINIQNSKEVIAVHQESLKLHTKALENEKELLRKAIEEK